MIAPQGCNAYDREPHLHGKGRNNEVGYTAERWLNLYSLMCGYQEHLEIDDCRITLYMESGGSLSVRASGGGANEWFTTDSIKEARAKFSELVTTHKIERSSNEDRNASKRTDRR